MTNDVYNAAIDEWGEELQVDKSIEELSELTRELSRWHLGYTNQDEICEEIADVQIMCEQLELLFDESRIEEHRERKLKRLRERIGGLDE